MSTPYIPTRDSLLDTWTANFNARIALAPAVYGLTPADSTAINTVVSNFHAAYLLATNPGTRTRVTVASKDAFRSVMLVLIRQFAQQIQANVGVSNSAKADLGLTIRDTSRTPIPAPTTWPVLSIEQATAGSQRLRFADSSTPTRRAKPVGATAMELYQATDDLPVVDPTLGVFIANFTVQPINVGQQIGNVGKTATYFARWINRRGQPGPWSAPVSLTIAF